MDPITSHLVCLEQPIAFLSKPVLLFFQHLFSVLYVVDIILSNGVTVGNKTDTVPVS